MNKKSENFVCEYCKQKEPHLVVVLNKGGDIHVHAPFENKYLLSIMIDAIIAEQKKYDKKL